MAVEAFPTWAGAKAEAEPARMAAMASFILSMFLIDFFEKVSF